ncbi:uncharacterized protein LOC119101528 [Pollicipes pollicipes]|uniref:uncharacterized protein LOC119101528 n=1 Tax=Pollicipes pollicipes TaxID=41117 RepID=UPI00188579CB|nr:uncharacterized protein LOC119101528 [Pollicipes pollicipes]
MGAYVSGKHPEPLPTSVTGCDNNLTSLMPSTTPLAANTSSLPLERQDDGFIDQYVYGISYQLYNLLGCLMCVIVGSVVSLLTGCNRQGVSKTLVNSLTYTLLNRFNHRQTACCPAGRDGPSDPQDIAESITFLKPPHMKAEADCAPPVGSTRP